MKFNKYWIIVAGITIANIFIFSAFSKKLETYVSDGMIEENQIFIDNINKKGDIDKQIDKVDKNNNQKKEDYF